MINLDAETRKLLYETSCKICCCKCHDLPTIMDPSDSYMMFLKHLDVCHDFGIRSIEDVENHVMRFFSKKDWPKYLQEKYESKD